MNYSYAYARSAEFMHSAIMEGFVRARVPGDVVFTHQAQAHRASSIAPWLALPVAAKFQGALSC